MERLPTKALDLTRAHSSAATETVGWLTVNLTNFTYYHQLKTGLSAIGRGPEGVHIRIDDPSISQCHAVIECLRDGTVFIEDKKSTNKTSCRNNKNGEFFEVQPSRCYQLQDGAEIILGSVRTIFTFADPRPAFLHSLSVPQHNDQGSSHAHNDEMLEPTLPATLIEPTLPFDNPEGEMTAGNDASIHGDLALEAALERQRTANNNTGGGSSSSSIDATQFDETALGEIADKPVALPSTDAPEVAAPAGSTETVAEPPLVISSQPSVAPKKDEKEDEKGDEVATATPVKATRRAPPPRKPAAGKGKEADENDEDIPTPRETRSAKKRKTEPSGTPEKLEFQWFFQSDLRFKETTAATSSGGGGESHVWTKYSPEDNERIEKDFKRGRKTLKLNETYTIDLKAMVQYRNEDTYKQRPVKREALPK